MSILNPGKGVDYYCYLSRDPFKVKFEYPGNLGKKTESHTFEPIEKMHKKNRQIQESDIGLLEHTGRFKWNALHNDKKVESRYVEIAPLTGNMGKTNMGDMLDTKSIINNDYSIAYGFYDSGAGIGDLTNQDQSWVYLTDNYSNWMEGLANDSGILNKPFSTFALPGSHDAGMFDTKRMDIIINNGTMLGILLGLLAPVIGWGLSALAALANPVIKRSVINFAFTQKDNIKTQLDLGTRYFDFRPGYCYPGLGDGKLYHQHSFIPGYSYRDFLVDILSWLKTHPKEIVVVSIGFAGFSDKSMKPTTDVLNVYLNDAMSSTKTKGEINTGNKNDLQTGVKTLLTNKKRLIFLNNGIGLDDAKKYDSYSDKSYQTTDVNKIIKRLDGMNSSGQAGNDLTVLQLQGTAQATGGGIFKSIATLSNASSPLLSTKPGFDNKTYPWVKDNSKKLLKNQLLVFLNDFADNALTSFAIRVTKDRS